MSGSLNVLSKENVNHVYRSISAKIRSRGERGQSEKRVHLQRLEHKMLSNKEWLAFLHNIEMKQHLFNLFVTYLSADDFVQSSPLSILINNENEIFKIPNTKNVVKCSSLFKRHGCSCFDNLCLCS